MLTRYLLCNNTQNVQMLKKTSKTLSEDKQTHFASPHDFTLPDPFVTYSDN